MLYTIGFDYFSEVLFDTVTKDEPCGDNDEFWCMKNEQ